MLVVLLVNNTVRWRVVMRAIDAVLPWPKTFQLLYIGIFFNQTLPSAVGGDAVRMYLARKSGLSLGSAINSVMLERVATVAGLILVVVATQPLLLTRIGDNPAKWVFPALALLLLAGVVFLMLLDRLPGGFKRWRIVLWFDHLAYDTRRLFLKPARAGQAVGLGATGNLLLSVHGYVLSVALGLDISLTDCLVLIPPVILITTIPISIAGWGVREAAMVGAFGFIGVPAESALSLSILFGLVNMVISLPGGLLWLTSGHSRKEIADDVAAS